MMTIPSLSDAALKLIVVAGIVVPVFAGLASLTLAKRSDREIAKANATAKTAEQHTAEAQAATVVAEQHIAEANARLQNAEARVAEAKLETQQVARRNKELDLRLSQTRSLVGQRVITIEQAKLLAKIGPECGRGVNVQIYDEFDAESNGFASSLAIALRQAGIKVNEAWRMPSLEASTGSDIVFYAPKYGGIDHLDKALNSEIYRFFKSIGLLALPISGAVNTPLGGTIVVGRTEENMQLNYCIMVVMKRPPPPLNGPVLPSYPGLPPKDTDFQ